MDELPELKKIADSFGVALATEEYMFPGIRRGKTAQSQYRLTAESAVREKLYGGWPITAQGAAEKLAEMERPPRLKGLDGFPCHAGHSVFSVNWKGEVQSCGMLPEPKISVLEHSFTDCWDYIVNSCRKLSFCQKCTECDRQNVCQVCPAMCYTETGSVAGCPDYICQMTDIIVRELEKISV